MTKYLKSQRTNRTSGWGPWKKVWVSWCQIHTSYHEDCQHLNGKFGSCQDGIWQRRLDQLCLDYLPALYCLIKGYHHPRYDEDFYKPTTTAKASDAYCAVCKRYMWTMYDQRAAKQMRNESYKLWAERK